MKKNLYHDERKQSAFDIIYSIASLDRFTVYTVRLNEDTSPLDVGVTGEVASGLLLIYNALNNENKVKFYNMSMLELLNIYTCAVEDGILTESKLKTTI